MSKSQSPRTPEFLASYSKSYGAWAGGKGRPADHSKCCKRVTPAHSWHSQQCSKPNGKGPHGAHCTMHDPIKVAERQRKSTENFYANERQREMRSVGRAIEALLLIEKGHNDPRSLAKETLDMYRAKAWWKEPK